MPNTIIKVSQYGSVSAQSVNPAELPRAHSIPAPEPIVDAKHQHQVIVNDAFQKAKSIVEAAQNYSLNQLQESTMRMNEECAQMKIRSYEDGYRSGLEEGKKEGLELGYEEGYQQGLKKAQEDFDVKNNEIAEKAKAEIQQLLDSIENRKNEVLDQFEADLQGLSITIAQKILRRELQTDSNTIQVIIENVLESYRNEAWVKINVSPTNAELLTKADRSIIQDLQKVSSNVKIVPDPALKDGDCVIDMPDKMVDAGVDTQMDQIKTALNL